MNLSVIFTQMMELFIILIIGFFLCRIGVMNADFTKRLNKMIMWVTLPALILSSVLSQTSGDRTVVMDLFKIAIIMYIALPVIALLLVLLIRVPKEERGIYMFMTVYSNIGFMGLPLIDAVYGDTAVFYTAIFNIVFNISAFTIGVVILHLWSSSKAKFQLKKIFNPGIIASVCAVILYLLGISFPEPVEDVIETLGDLTTPLAMLLIGATLGQMKIKEILCNWRIYPFALIKQLVLPLLIWPFISHLIDDPMILGIVLILNAMPVANTSVIFATEYNRSEHTAACGVFITTLMSIITVPLIVYLCGL